MPPSFDPDPSRDPDVPPGGDKRLWLGLIGLFTAILLAAITMHRLFPSPALPPAGAGGNAKLNNGVPQMTRQQLIESQQAMPELFDFDPKTPPPNALQGGDSVGTPETPSSLGSRGLGR